MLRVIQNTSTAMAKSYFSTADYYSEGQELMGTWQGKGAHQLGLIGLVKQGQWDRLCDNIHPSTGQKLTLRNKSNRTVGYDFNFHVPKSVSLLYATTRDARILTAFRDAVGATMRDIEAEASTRVRKDGKNEERVTGNLAWGEYIHFTARPVDGLPDPHLHAHCFVFNTTWDEQERAWKAGQFRELKRDAPYFEALYQSRLARNLGDLGLPIQRTGKGWEIAGMPQDLLRRFSRRTAEIEKRAKELGITDPKAKAELGAKTRNRKAKDLPFPELQLQWQARMSPRDQDALARVADLLGGEVQPRDLLAAGRAVDFAAAHEFERASVVPERKLLATALKRAVGEAGPGQVIRRYQNTSLIRKSLDGRMMVTSKNVLAEEREIVAFAKTGRGRCKALVAKGHVIQREKLNDSQRRAVHHILESRDRVIAVRGAAGVGKTTLMQEAVETIEKAGTRVVACAPSAAASRGVLRSDGFAGADTVARLLLDDNMQEKARGQLIWVDEAGLLGTRTLRDLFRLADRIDARVLLTGDRRQHGSVERGAALRLLEVEAGIKSAEVSEIERPKGEHKELYKRIVKDLSGGRVGAAFKALDGAGWIREIPDDERYEALAADYAKAVAGGETALVVSPTHQEGRFITSEIRRLLKEQGAVSGQEREFSTLVGAKLTEAEKTDGANYLPGDVIQFVQNAKGFVKGQRVTVDGGALPLEHAHRYAAFHRSYLRLAKGDVIRITHNGFTADGKHRLDNGGIFTVKDFDRRGNIVLNNGWTVSRDFGHLAYGYAVTSHASQSRTVDRVFIGQSGDSAAAASKEQFYVSVSRGRHKATIYTDDKKALLEAVMQSPERMTATQLAGHEEMRERQRRMEYFAERESAGIERPRELAHER